jgi:hypothetical protein
MVNSYLSAAACGFVPPRSVFTAYGWWQKNPPNPEDVDALMEDVTRNPSLPPTEDLSEYIRWRYNPFYLSGSTGLKIHHQQYKEHLRQTQLQSAPRVPVPDDATIACITADTAMLPDMGGVVGHTNLTTLIIIGKNH